MRSLSLLVLALIATVSMANGQTIPVARNVWQHVEGGSPATAARRLIIARTTHRSSSAKPPSGLPLAAPPVAERPQWRTERQAASARGSGSLGDSRAPPRDVSGEGPIRVGGAAPEHRYHPAPWDRRCPA